MVTLQIPVDEITASAREVQVSRVLLTVFLGLFYVIGWAAGRTVLGCVMGAYAIRRGWREGFPAIPRVALSEQPR